MEESYSNGLGVAYLKVIATYFSFIEIVAIGLMFWISCGASGALILNLFNMPRTPSEMIPSSSSWFVKAYDFIKGWTISTMTFIGLGLGLCIFLLCGILATGLLSMICNIVGISEPNNFLGTSVGMTVAIILGNTVALVKTLSKQIKWLQCGNEFPVDHEMRAQKFKNLNSYLLDFEKDDVGKWPRN